MSPPKTSKIIDFWHFRKFLITPRENWDPGDKSRYQVFQLTPKTVKVTFTLKLVFAKPIVRWPSPLKISRSGVLVKNARTCVFELVIETCFSELFLLRKVILSYFGRELRGYGIRTWPTYQSQTRTKTVLRTRVRETTLILSPRPTTWSIFPKNITGIKLLQDQNRSWCQFSKMSGRNHYTHLQLVFFRYWSDPGPVTRVGCG